MKRIFAIALVAAVAIAGLAVWAASKGKMTFDQTTYDFGTIQEAKGPVSHVFRFTNTGDANLVIIDATAQCGCTRPEYSEKPIAPGKKGEVKVTYNPARRPGAFDKTVTIRTNGSPSKIRLKIKGNVVPKAAK